MVGSSQLAGWLLALIQLGNPLPVEQFRERVQHVEPDDALLAEAQRELDTARDVWTEDVRDAESVDAALLEIVGSFEFSDLLYLMAQVSDRIDVQEGDSAAKLLESVPSDQHGRIAPLLESLSSIEKLNSELKAGQKANALLSAAFADLNPEDVFRVLNEACFGVRTPPKIRKRMQSTMCFVAASVIGPVLLQDPEELPSGKLDEFLGLWARHADTAVETTQAIAGLACDGDVPAEYAAAVSVVLDEQREEDLLLKALVAETKTVGPSKA